MICICITFDFLQPLVTLLPFASARTFDTVLSAGRFCLKIPAKNPSLFLFPLNVDFLTGTNWGLVLFEPELTLAGPCLPNKSVCANFFLG